MAQRIVPEGGWSHRLKPVRTPRVEKVSHRQFIKSLPCICCLVEGTVVPADDPMHIRSGSRVHGKEPAGGAQTSDDRWTLPGCRRHHDEQHENRGGGELLFWTSYGIDPFLLALILWGLSGNHHAAVLVIGLHASVGRDARLIEGARRAAET